MNYTRPKETELTVTRTIPATAAEVYDVWLDAKSPGSPWFGARRAILDTKVDGLFYFSVPHEGRDWAHCGRFILLDRAKRIEHTWVSEATRGLESVVSLSFEPDGDKTRVTLRHTGVPDDEFGRQHREGWDFALQAIEARFAKRGR
jgi:uncharacterized protein YndB with AHSA1/START domain